MKPIAGSWNVSPDGILLSQDSRVVFTNAAALRLLGATSPETVLGKPLLDIFHPESHAPVAGPRG